MTKLRSNESKFDVALLQARRAWKSVAARSKMVSHKAATAENYLQLAEAQREGGNLGAADAILREATLKYPTNGDLINEFARIAMLRKDWTEALERSQCALEVFGDQAPPFLYLINSTAHRKLGRLDAAETILREGKDKHPKDTALQREFAESPYIPEGLARGSSTRPTRL